MSFVWFKSNSEDRLPNSLHDGDMLHRTWTWLGSIHGLHWIGLDWVGIFRELYRLDWIVFGGTSFFD